MQYPAERTSMQKSDGVEVDIILTRFLDTISCSYRSVTTTAIIYLLKCLSVPHLYTVYVYTSK
jgi:hypothetical protein